MNPDSLISRTDRIFQKAKQTLINSAFAGVLGAAAGSFGMVVGTFGAQLAAGVVGLGAGIALRDATIAPATSAVAGVLALLGGVASVSVAGGVGVGVLAGEVAASVAKAGAAAIGLGTVAAVGTKALAEWSVAMIRKELELARVGSLEVPSVAAAAAVAGVVAVVAVVAVAAKLAGVTAQRTVTIFDRLRIAKNNQMNIGAGVFLGSAAAASLTPIGLGMLNVPIIFLASGIFSGMSTMLRR